MANPVVRVILSAVDEVSGTAKKAGDALDGFGGKIAGLYKAAAALVAGSVLAKFFDDSIKEAAAAEVQMGRLGTAVANAGGDFQKLKGPLEETVKSVQRMSTATDDDLREALTRMIAVSGDTAGSMKNLSLVADLAAYKNIGLSEAADIVGKAMNGNTTAFNKLGIAGKDATSVLTNAQATFGGFAANEAASFSGRLTQIGNQWGEFKEAVGTAILATGEAGGAATGLATVLANLAGWVEKNEAVIGLTVSAIGRFLGALFEVGKAVYEVVQPALGPVVKVLFGTLMTLLESASFGVRFLGATFKGLAGDTLTALGTIVQKGGALLKLFGVQAVAETGTSLRTFGEQLSASARENVETATKTWKAGMRDLLAGATSAHAEQQSEETRHQKTVTRIHEDGHKERQTKAQIAAEVNAELLRQANAIYAEVSKALQKTAVPVITEIGETWATVNEKLGGIAKRIDVAKESQKELAAATKDVNDDLKYQAYLAGQTDDRLRATVDSALSFGQSLVSAAEGMGALDAKAASTLNSVLNMGASIAKFGIGSPEGLLSIIGGLATVIGRIGPQNKAATDLNSQRLAELSRDLSDYNGAATGRTFSGVTAVLGSVLDQFDVNKLTAKDVQTFLPQIKAGLAAAGLSEADVENLAKKYGVDLKDPKGYFALLQILRTRKYGSAEGNFSDELASLTESFTPLGITDADDQLVAFRKFAKKNIPVLADALEGDLTSEGGRASIVGKLRQLYRDSIDGKIPIADYKGATPQQLRQLITTLLPLLGDANGVLGSGEPVAPSGVVPAASGALAPTGGLGGLATLGVSGATGLAALGTGPSDLGVLQIPSAPTPSLAGAAALPAAPILIDRAQFGPFEFPNVRSAEDAEGLYTAIMERASRELSRIRDAQGNAERT